ncbi:phage head spike fiber domain-containing protein [Sphingomonas hankookensis]|uniref:phage head spike fiber domain-containing protein n=1 Tax=Sphingomonas hankookensis TaxID=563996 RepID=UPI003F78E27A
MATTARLDLSIWRSDEAYDFVLRIIGPDLRNADLRAEIRPEHDTSGLALIDLAKVTDPAEQGLYVAAVRESAGTWQTEICIGIGKAARQALPDAGESGTPDALRWILAIDGMTRLEGRVFVLAHALNSDAAPADRAQSYAYTHNSADPASSGVTLTIGQESRATVIFDGGDLLGDLVERATTAADDVRTRLATEDRAALFGVTDPLLALEFGARGIEMDFVTGYFRDGHDKNATIAGLNAVPFTRDSTATFQIDDRVVRNFDTGTPRLLPGQGLVVEPPATNLVRYSAEFGNAVWDRIATGTGVLPVVQSNVATAPDGSMTADRISLGLGTGSTLSDRSQLQQDVQTVPGQAFWGSLFVKGEVGEKILLRHVGGSGYMVHAFNGEWQRIGRRETALGATAQVEIALRGGAGSSAATTFLAWGAQLERGTVPTSYVPTAATTATRQQDTLLLTGLALGEMTIVIDVALIGGGTGTMPGRRVAFTAFADTGAIENVTVVNDDIGGIGAVIQSGGDIRGVTRLDQVMGEGETQRIALRLSPDDTRLMRNGVPGLWLWDVRTPAVLTRIMVGGSPLSTLARLGGIVKRIVVLPFALPDSALSVLTGGPPYPAGEITWQRIIKHAAFSDRDSARTFSLGGKQYIANGYRINGVYPKDIWSSDDGINYSLVNANPGYEVYSHMAVLGTTIYAFRTKMYESDDGGLTWTEILGTLPWGILSGDAPVIVHRGKLLAFHSTGNVPVEANEGVWEYDPTANKLEPDLCGRVGFARHSGSRGVQGRPVYIRRAAQGFQCPAGKQLPGPNDAWRHVEVDRWRGVVGAGFGGPTDAAPTLASDDRARWPVLLNGRVQPPQHGATQLQRYVGQR